MTITQKTKTYLAVILFVLLAVSIIYNLTRDPRSLYESTENPRQVLLEQQRHRRNVSTEIHEESLLKIGLLDSSAAKYSSERSRNIFSLAAPPEPIVKQKSTPPTVIAQPVVQMPVAQDKPFTYVGFAQSDGKNFAVLLEKNTSKMFIAYDGVNLGNAYIVKFVDRKKVMLINSNTNEEMELTLTE
jgi:hypothetical protein